MTDQKWREKTVKELFLREQLDVRFSLLAVSLRASVALRASVRTVVWPRLREMPAFSLDHPSCPARKTETLLPSNEKCWRIAGSFGGFMHWKVSLFTACAPWVSLDLLAPICAKAGLQGLDLAVKEQAFDPAKPINYWGNNAAGVNLVHLETELPRIQNILTSTELACPVLCSYLQASEVEKIRRLAQAAKTLGVPMVRVWSPSPRPGQVRNQVEETRSQWRVLSAIAAEYGIRFVLELHDRTITSSPSGALRILDGLNPAHVGVILDIGNMAIEGNEPLAMSIELLGPYLAHVHVKDLVFQEGSNWNGAVQRFVPLGEGCIRWTECLKLLAAANYQGWLVLENFSRLERGPDRIAEDLAWLHARMKEV